jgi:hypothetical protein
MLFCSAEKMEAEEPDLFLCRDLVFLNLFMALPLILLARLRLPLFFLTTLWRWIGCKYTAFFE